MKPGPIGIKAFGSSYPKCLVKWCRRKAEKNNLCKVHQVSPFPDQDLK
jgi:hypothetical protein